VTSAREKSVLALGLALVACAQQAAPAPVVGSPPETKAPPVCDNPRSDGSVLLVDWPEPRREELKQRLAKGTVAVAFDGCKTELLPACTPTGAYDWVALTAYRGEVTMLDAEELRSELPFRSKTLADELAHHGEMRFDFVLGGRWQGAVGNGIRLAGACERATHLVTALDVGSYALVAGPPEELASSAERKIVERAGDARACLAEDSRAPVAECSSLLRLELSPISKVVGKDGCQLRTRWDGSRCAPVEPSAWCPARSYWNGSECVADDDSLVAQADYLKVDDRIRTSDLGPTAAAYTGTPVEVIQRYRREAEVALSLYRELDHVIESHSSPEWRAIATARQAVLYYTLYVRLDNARAPNVYLFNEEQLGMLQAADESGNRDLIEKAASIRAKVGRAWRDAKQKELAGAGEVLVDRFARALFIANEARTARIVSSAATVVLGDLTPQLGPERLETALQRVRGVPYSSGVFVRMVGVLQQTPAQTLDLKVPCPEGLVWSGIGCGAAE
jgi:hypothetical protein